MQVKMDLAVLTLVLEYVPASDILSFSVTNREYQSMGRADSVWCKMILRDFGPEGLHIVMTTESKLQRYFSLVQCVPKTVEQCVERAQNGQLLFLRYAYEHYGLEVPRSVTQTQTIPDEVYEHFADVAPQTLTYEMSGLKEAVGSGSLATVQWMYARGYAVDTTVVILALKHNDIEIVRWLLTLPQIAQSIFGDCLKQALRHEQTAIVQTMLSLPIEFDDHFADAAAEHGSVELVTFFAERGIFPREYTMNRLCGNRRYKSVLALLWVKYRQFQAVDVITILSIVHYHTDLLYVLLNGGYHFDAQSVSLIINSATTSDPRALICRRFIYCLFRHGYQVTEELLTLCHRRRKWKIANKKFARFLKSQGLYGLSAE